MSVVVKDAIDELVEQLYYIDGKAEIVNGEIVLMSIDTGKYYGLDAIGSDIWGRLQTPIRVEALCNALAADYDAEAGRIEGDVIALLEELLEQGLVEVKG